MEKRKPGRPRKAETLTTKSCFGKRGRYPLKEEDTYEYIKKYVLKECRKRNMLITRVALKVLGVKTKKGEQLKKSEFIKIKDYLDSLGKVENKKPEVEAKTTFLQKIISFFKGFKYAR